MANQQEYGLVTYKSKYNVPMIACLCVKNHKIYFAGVSRCLRNTPKYCIRRAEMGIWLDKKR